MKKVMAEKVGFNSVERKLDEDVSAEELLSTVRELNDDDAIDGILVQLPLPDHLPQKEVRRWHDMAPWWTTITCGVVAFIA